MTEDKPDAIVIHVGTNDILNHANHEDIVRNIKNILLDCKNNGVSEMFISSILVRKNFSLLRRFNDMLKNLWEKNAFGFICNDVTTTDYL